MTNVNKIHGSRDCPKYFLLQTAHLVTWAKGSYRSLEIIFFRRLRSTVSRDVNVEASPNRKALLRMFAQKGMTLFVRQELQYKRKGENSNAISYVCQSWFHPLSGYFWQRKKDSIHAFNIFK